MIQDINELQLIGGRWHINEITINKYWGIPWTSEWNLSEALSEGKHDVPVNHESGVMSSRQFYQGNSRRFWSETCHGVIPCLMS